MTTPLSNVVLVNGYPRGQRSVHPFLMELAFLFGRWQWLDIVQGSCLHPMQHVNTTDAKSMT